MRIIIQRVGLAKVTVENEIVAQINNGLLILLGITTEDTQEDIDWLIKKIVNLRLFNDKNGKMNFSVKDIKGDILVVSQFTLYASTKKGNRPSFTKSAKSEIAIPIYHQFIKKLQENSLKKVQTGVFGADMKISLINDGPVTISLDSKNRE